MNVAPPSHHCQKSITETPDSAEPSLIYLKKKQKGLHLQLVLVPDAHRDFGIENRCDLYIIASVRSGIAQAMPEMFPGCSVENWIPVKPELRGKVKEAYQYLKKRLRKSRDPNFYIPFADIQKAMKMEKANFKNNVHQKEDFQEAVTSLGLAEWGKGKLFTGYRKVGNT